MLGFRMNRIQALLIGLDLYLQHTQHESHKRDPLPNLTTSRETLVIDNDSVGYAHILKDAWI